MMIVVLVLLTAKTFSWKSYQRNITQRTALYIPFWSKVVKVDITWSPNDFLVDWSSASLLADTLLLSSFAFLLLCCVDGNYESLTNTRLFALSYLSNPKGVMSRSSKENHRAKTKTNRTVMMICDDLWWMMKKNPVCFRIGGLLSTQLTIPYIQYSIIHVEPKTP